MKAYLKANKEGLLPGKAFPFCQFRVFVLVPSKLFKNSDFTILKIAKSARQLLIST